VPFEINYSRKIINRFKANGWIRVGLTNAITKIAKKTFGYGNLFITLKGVGLFININIVPKNQ
jgi:hypothetical protein